MYGVNVNKVSSFDMCWHNDIVSKFSFRNEFFSSKIAEIFSKKFKILFIFSK